jgi:hypothetical protein
MPYLYSLDASIAGSPHTSQKGRDEQVGTITTITSEINHWLTEIGSWASTIEETSSARHDNMYLGDYDVKPPHTRDLPLGHPSRSFDRSFEGEGQYRWTGFRSNSVTNGDSNEWMEENDADSRDQAEAEDAGRLSPGKVDKGFEYGIYRELGVVQMPRDMVPLDGHLLSARGGKGKGEALLRWLTEEGPWYPGSVGGTLQENRFRR